MRTSIIIPLMLLILGCTSFSEKGKDTPQEDTKEQTSISQEVVQVFELGSNGSILELLKDESENAITLQTKKNGEIISKVGCGNSAYVKREDGAIKVDTLSFSKSNDSYLVTAYIRGSTYGAECYFIVFKKTQWLVMALPFDRARLYDVDQEGFDEIVEYKSQADSAIHSFNSGLVVPE